MPSSLQPALPSESRCNDAFRHPSQVWLAAAALAFILYDFTSAPGVIWQDGGELQVRVALDDVHSPYDLARAHPVTVLLGSAFKHLGVDAARAANLVSVIGGAVTVAGVAALLAALRLCRLAVVAAAVMLACSHTLWQFSAAAETNTVVTALLVTELLAVHRFATTGRPIWLYAFGFLNGVGVANHNLALLSLAAYGLVALALIRRWNRHTVRNGLIAAVCWLVGFTPMLVLIVGDILHGETVTNTIQSFLFGRYGGFVFNTSFGLKDLVEIASYVGLNFPTPLILALPLGVAVLRRRTVAPFFAAFLLLFLVHFAFAVRYNVVDQYSFFIPSYVLMAVFLAAGLDEILRKIETSKNRKIEKMQPAAAASPNTPEISASEISNLKSEISNSRLGASFPIAMLVLLLALLPIAVYVALPTIARRLPPSMVPIPKRPIPYRDPYNWFLQPWRFAATGPERFARETFDALQPNAIALVDPSLRPPLVYLQITESLRRDVQVCDGTWQPWLTPVDFNVADPAAADVAVAAGRVFISSDDWRYTPNYIWMLNRYDLTPAGRLFKASLKVTR